MRGLPEWNEDVCDNCGRTFEVDLHFDCEKDMRLVTTWRRCATWIYTHLMMLPAERPCTANHERVFAPHPDPCEMCESGWPCGFRRVPCPECKAAR